MKNKRAPDDRYQHRLAEVGLYDEQSDHRQQEQKRKYVCRHIGSFRGFAEQPRDDDDKGGFEEFRRLDVDAKQHKPTPRSLDFGSEIRCRGHHDKTHDEYHQRQVANLAWAEKRHTEHHRDRRQHIKNVPVDEKERVKTEAGGNRRTCGQRKHNAGKHQRADGGEREPVDRPPPFTKRCALCA